MKTHGSRPNQARHLQRYRKTTARVHIRQGSGLGRVVVGIVPRSWSIDAANDPQA